MKRKTFHINMPSLSHYYKEILKRKLWVITSQGIFLLHTPFWNVAPFPPTSPGIGAQRTNPPHPLPESQGSAHSTDRHPLPPSKSRAVRLSHPGRWLGTVQGTQSTVTSHSQPLFLRRCRGISAKRNKNGRDRPERRVRAEAAADGVAADRASGLSLTPPTSRRPPTPSPLAPVPGGTMKTTGSQAGRAAGANFRPGPRGEPGGARRPLRRGRRHRYPKTAEPKTLSARCPVAPSPLPLVSAPGTRPERPSLPRPLLT